jgi:hypothetical protein
MTVGSAINKEYVNKELVVCDAYGRVLMLDSRGVYGDGMYHASNGSFHGGYPESENTDYMTGTIDNDITGTTTSASANKLVDTGATFAAWLVGCQVIDSASNTAIITAVDDANTLSIDTDIFASGEAYTIQMTALLTIGADLYTYVVDSSAAWLDGVNSGTDFSYIGLRGLWTQFISADGETIQQARVVGNETNKLWFSGAFSTALAGGDAYYVAGIYYEFETGYIHGDGRTISLAEASLRVASTNGSSFYLEPTGSGRDLSVEDSSELVESFGQWIRDEPSVRIKTGRHKWVKVRVKGVAQNDQLVFRGLQFRFEEHTR